MVDEIINEKLEEYLFMPGALSGVEETIAERAFKAGFRACLKDFEDRGAYLSGVIFKDDISMVWKDFRQSDYPDFNSYFQQHTSYYYRSMGKDRHNALHKHFLEAKQIW